MSGASQLNPMNQDRQRHPKACKVQMFTRHEQVWLDAVNSSVRANVNPKLAVDHANIVLDAFKNKFENN